jgi:hypothetical protein
MEYNERAEKKFDEKHLISRPLSPPNFDSSPETSRQGENHQIERSYSALVNE